MTLSLFLRDYLYIPLGGNRCGPLLRNVNLLITMALGGLWHGANWTFVIWGVLHGLYLCVNHAWNHFAPPVAPRFARVASMAAFMLTFLSVRRRLGVLPRRHAFVGDLYPVADGRSRPCCLRSRRDGAGRLRRRLCGACVFAPNTQTIMGYDHKARTSARRPAPGRRGRSFLYASAAVLGARDSRNPAVQRIHLFQVLMSTSLQKNLIHRSGRFSFLARARSSSLPLPRSISSSIRCSCCGRRASLPRCIQPTAGCRTPD